MKDLIDQPQNKSFFKKYESLKDLKENCTKALQTYEEKCKEIVNSSLINDELLTQIDRADLLITEVFNELEVTELMHPEESWRDFASEFIKKVNFAAEYTLSFLTLQNKAIYSKLISNVDPAKLRTKEAKYLFKLIKTNCEINGIKLSSKEAKELEGLRTKAKELDSTFSRNIADHIPVAKFKESELKDCPQDIIDANREKDGSIKIKLVSNNKIAILTQCSVKATREKVLKLSGEYARPLNKDILVEFLNNYQRSAEICGFKNYATISALPRMANDPETIEGFIKNLFELAKDRTLLEINSIKKLKESMGDTTKMTSGDRIYYSERLVEKLSNLKESEIRPFFPYEFVKVQILKIFEEMFNLEFKADKSSKPWHKDIETLLVYSSDKVIGRIHLDMHPRDGKYTHACQAIIKRGIKNFNIPEAILICNFNKPNNNSDGLQSLDEVSTFFHEFGHLIHEVLGSQNNEFASTGGTSVQWDFVEAPSQLLEEILLNEATLKRLSSHHKTGKPLNDDLIKKILNQDRPLRAASISGQGVFSMISLKLFTIPNITWQAIEDLEKELAKKYLLVDDKKYYVSYSFGHLTGYTSNYYTYMWSLAIAKDLFTQFNHKNLLDTKVADKYRRTILEPGGSKPAAELVEDFLGRPWNMDAFKAYLKEGEELLKKV